MTAATFEAFSKKRRPFMAIAAVARMLKNKEATYEVYRMTAGLDGGNYETGFQDFKNSPIGKKVLEEKIDLIDTLSNTEYLASLPEGSLGRAYLDFITSEGLTAQGFQDEMDMSGERFDEAGVERQRYLYRMRHTHDLQHVLTGYGRDLVGELSLLNFSQGRFHSWGISLLIFVGRFKARKDFAGFNSDTCINEGKKLGQQVTNFTHVDWEDLLTKPLDEAREYLNIGKPTEYFKVKERAGELDRHYRDELAAQHA